METRVQRYKDYRAQLVSDGAKELNKDEKPILTTTALPIKEVMESIDEHSLPNRYYQRQKIIRVVEFALIVLLLIAVVVGLIMFGIYAFRG